MAGDRAFSRASLAPRRTRRWPAYMGVLMGLFACVIGMLTLFAPGVSRRSYWYAPMPISQVSSSEAHTNVFLSRLRLRPRR